MKALARLKLSEWLPDQSELDNPGSPFVENAVWVNGCYQPALAFSSLGYAANARPQGAFAGTDDDGNSHIYVGSAAKIEEYNGAGFTDRSGATYTTQAGRYWKFAQLSTPNFGNLIFATNFNDVLQQIEASTDSAFSATPGTPPKASAIGVIGEIVMLGNTEEVTNGAVPNRVQWCGISDPTNWAFGTLAAQEAQAGEQFLNAAFGAVTHIADGSDSGLIFQERAITRAPYVGGDAIFEFIAFEKQRGTPFPNSPVQLGNNVYFLAHDGFCSTDGGQVQQIGHGKCDTEVLNDINLAFTERFVGAYDSINKLVRWCWCSAGNSTGIPDRTVTYNVAEQRFSPITQDVSWLFTSKSFGYTMDTLDNVDTNLDNIPESLDNPVWQGGNAQIGALDSSNNYGTLTGDALDATIDTLEMEPSPGFTVYVDGIRPVVTGATSITAALLTRDLENNSYTVGSDIAQDSRTGICEQRADGRYIRARLKIVGGFDSALGADVLGTESGEL